MTDELNERRGEDQATGEPVSSPSSTDLKDAGVPAAPAGVELEKMLSIPDDSEFLKRAYRTVLQQSPREYAVEYELYREELKGGRAARIAILGRLRYSARGREVACPIPGFAGPFFLWLAISAPLFLAKYLLQLIVGLIKLPRLKKRQATLELLEERRLAAAAEEAGEARKAREEAERQARAALARLAALENRVEAQSSELSEKLGLLEARLEEQWRGVAAGQEALKAEKAGRSEVRGMIEEAWPRGLEELSTALAEMAALQRRLEAGLEGKAAASEMENLRATLTEALENRARISDLILLKNDFFKYLELKAGLADLQAARQEFLEGLEREFTTVRGEFFKYLELKASLADLDSVRREVTGNLEGNKLLQLLGREAETDAMAKLRKELLARLEERNRCPDRDEPN